MAIDWYDVFPDSPFGAMALTYLDQRNEERRQLAEEAQLRSQLEWREDLRRREQEINDEIERRRLYGKV